MSCLYSAAGINTNMTLRDDWFYPNEETGIFLLFQKHKSKRSLKITNPIYLTWHGIVFIFIFIILLSILVICLCYRRLLVNLIVNLWSKIKTNNNIINEHVTILHQTPSLNKSSSIYLTVPPTIYYYH